MSEFNLINCHGQDHSLSEHQLTQPSQCKCNMAPYQYSQPIIHSETTSQAGNIQLCRQYRDYVQSRPSPTRPCNTMCLHPTGTILYGIYITERCEPPSLNSSGQPLSLLSPLVACKPSHTKVPMKDPRRSQRSSTLPSALASALSLLRFYFTESLEASSSPISV